jgi:hypothetical protein
MLNQPVSLVEYVQDAIKVIVNKTAMPHGKEGHSQHLGHTTFAVDRFDHQ